MKEDDKITHSTDKFCITLKPKDAIPTFRDLFTDLQYVLKKYILLFLLLKVTKKRTDFLLVTVSAVPVPSVDAELQIRENLVSI